MAYDRKDGISYLDDIPLKIASAFLPPPTVVLPGVLNTNEELFFEKVQYDFSLEKKVLEDIKRLEDLKSCENSLNTGDASNKLQSNPGTDASVKPNIHSILSLQSDILLPKPQKILDKVSNIDEQNNSKINLSDFENDTSSPFDYMELQTINDLEELSNVFQGLNNKYSSDNNVYKDNGCDSGGHNENVASNVSKSMSFPLQNNDSGFGNTEKYLTCPKEPAVQSLDAWNTVLTMPKENCFYPVPSPKFESASTGKILSRTFNSCVLPEVPCLPSVTFKNNNVENALPSMASRSTLRGCKSYSDIHDLSEQSIKLSAQQGRSSTPTAVACSDIDTQLDHLLGQANKISPSDANCDNSSPASGLQDPYEELTEDSRKFVDAIVDMGFPRAQVSRTVKHLGADEKTVVEHLCQIQSLEENGYDCLEAEAALHLHDYNQEQAKQFLDLISKFQDLGFEKNAVKKALIQNKNDWSKTIDALLS